MNCPQCDTYNQSTAVQCDCGYLFAAAERVRKRKDPSTKVGPLNRILIVILVVSLCVFSITFFYTPNLPDKSEILPQLYHAPIQDDAAVPDPFMVEKKGMFYRIAPKFEYQLNGLVVSTHDADSLSDVLHEQWKDYLNIMDICVIWGANIDNEVYHRIEFSSGNFTCFCRWFDAQTGKMFHGDALSNNHLLTDDKRIAKKILKVKPGDQISFKGFLAAYENQGYGFSRGTSTSRTDTGNRACETVYVTDFEILKKGQVLLPILKNLSLFSMLISLAGIFTLPFIIKH